MTVRILIRILACSSVLIATLMGSAHAHHSFALFDQSHPATLSGTVKQFVLGNPHTLLMVLVPAATEGGDPEEWSLEGASVSRLIRAGWTKDMLQPGMKVKVLLAPRKDGTHGGALLRVIDINGKPALNGVVPLGNSGT